jgi:hypothetical protein
MGGRRGTIVGHRGLFPAPLAAIANILIVRDDHRSRSAEELYGIRNHH